VLFHLNFLLLRWFTISFHFVCCPVCPRIICKYELKMDKEIMSSSSLSYSLIYFPPSSLTSQNLKNNDLFIHNFNTIFEVKQLHACFIKSNTHLSILPLTKVAFVCALSLSFSYTQQIFSHPLWWIKIY
jgi:hypothetical protein